MRTDESTPPATTSSFASLWIPVLIGSVGFVLAAYMMYAEGEPGGIPLILVTTGIVWHLVARLRSDS